MHTSQHIRLFHHIEQLQYRIDFGASLRIELEELCEEVHEMFGCFAQLPNNKVSLLKQFFFSQFCNDIFYVKFRRANSYHIVHYDLEVIESHQFATMVEERIGTKVCFEDKNTQGPYIDCLIVMIIIDTIVHNFGSEIHWRAYKRLAELAHR
jgi:hypothetical protein